MEEVQEGPSQIKFNQSSLHVQIKEGITERIPDLKTYMKGNPQCSFLPFLEAFREQRETIIMQCGIFIKPQLK